MHGRTLPRWLKGKRMGKNLKGKEMVDPRIKDKEARSTYIIGKGRLERGKEKCFLDLPGKMPGKARKKGRWRGVSGYLSHSLITHTT